MVYHWPLFMSLEFGNWFLASIFNFLIYLSWFNLLKFTLLNYSLNLEFVLQIHHHQSFENRLSVPKSWWKVKCLLPVKKGYVKCLVSCPQGSWSYPESFSWDMLWNRNCFYKIKLRLLIDGRMIQQGFFFFFLKGSKNKFY